MTQTPQIPGMDDKEQGNGVDHHQKVAVKGWPPPRYQKPSPDEQHRVDVEEGLKLTVTGGPAEGVVGVWLTGDLLGPPFLYPLLQGSVEQFIGNLASKKEDLQFEKRKESDLEIGL